MAGVKDGRIAMFLDGPYVMGLLKDGAPELKGKWAIASAPYSKEPGSYLGGTGLAIPVNAPHKAAAWAFVQYLLQLKQQLLVASAAGAAPATTAALQSPQLSKPDPYFGDQQTFPIFLKTMSTATHFPYVKQWDAIDTAISDGVGAALLGKKSPKDALDGAAATADDKLAGG
jgi:ABC-type glycerol-3-phosphate transport system substrate-binding protein